MKIKVKTVRVQTRPDSPRISGGVLIVLQFEASGPQGSEVFAPGKQSVGVVKVEDRLK